MRKELLMGLMAILLCAATAYAQTPRPGAAACDRGCLNGILEQYLNALVAQDPSKAPMARNVYYTANGQHLLPGDGYWRSVTGRGTYELVMADVPKGEVAAFTTMREAGTPLIMAVRLKVENRRITEIEELLAHSPDGAKALDAIGKPREAFMRETPPARRMSRADLIKTANMYFSGMQQNDGEGVYPFADDCDRLENGAQTTNNPTGGRPGAPPPPPNAPPPVRPDPKTATNYSSMWTCREQFESGLLHFVSRIRDRRYVLVDQERGVVLAFAFFDHEAGKTRTFQTPSGRTVTAGPVTPWTWELAEAFKVEDGKLHQIEAVLERAPYGMGSGWSTWAQAMSTEARGN
ncbi:MAG TPA: hypothetical protein VG871_13065 [Vicinamibacterales bacterium]|nr:hypothetical protein [Vicinamibacterales bacterium]